MCQHKRTLDYACVKYVAFDSATDKLFLAVTPLKS